MKKLLAALMYLAIISLAQCKKDTSSLPPETQYGAGTFGCKINGKVWVPAGSDYATGQNTTAFNQKIYPGPTGYVFVISAVNYNNKPYTDFSIGFDSLKASTGIPIILTTGKPGHGGAGFNNGLQKFTTSQNVKGELTFKRFDETSLIASGVFWFDGINGLGDTIHVTEGRFDVKFTR